MIQLSRTAAAWALALAGLHAQAAPVVTSNTNALALANALTGGNVTVLSASFAGAATQAGTFSNGASSVGFGSGVVLSTGDVASIPGNNTTGSETTGVGGGTGNGQITTNTGAAGYAPLDTISGGTSFDGSVLTIRFQFGDGSVGGNLGVRYVFASEEYINYVGSQFNDVFAFLLDGVNIALVPGSSTAVAINTVNAASNPGRYINNVANASGLPNAGRDLQFDGLTTVLTAAQTGLGAGVHTMTFAIADIADANLDSAVFLEAGSFSTDTIGEVPEPGSLALAALALAGLAVRRRRSA